MINMSKILYRVFLAIMLVCLLGVGVVIGYNYSKSENINSDLNGSIDNSANESMVDNENGFELKKVDNNAILTSNTDIYNDDENDIQMVNSDNAIIKKDIKVTYIDYYSLCKDEIENSKVYPNTTIEEVKQNEIKRQNANKEKYDIIDEGKDKIVYRRIVNTYCPNHYVVKIEKNKINIYSLITNDKKEFVKSLDTPVSNLRKEVENELIGGVIVSSNDELKSIIEDIES